MEKRKSSETRPQAEDLYRIEFYVPEAEADRVLEALFAAGAGAIGRYDRCCWRTAGVGQFRPLSGSHPACGEVGRVERLPEIKVEMVCAASRVEAALRALIDAHPYETPAYALWKIHLEPRERRQT